MKDDDEELWARCFFGGLFWLLLMIHACLAGWIACRFQPGLYELTLLEAGVRLINEGNIEFDRTTPPIFKVVAASPIAVREVKLDWELLKREAIARGGQQPQTEFDMRSDPTMWSIVLCRFVCIAFSLVGIFYCYLWASEIFGTTSGLVAAALWSFSPGMLGHAGLISPDVAAATLGVMLMYHLRRWMLEPTYVGAVIVGVVMGCALLIKLVWISALIIVPLTWLIYILVFRAGEWGIQRLLQNSVQLIFAVIISLLIVNAGYGFHDSFLELGEFEFQSEMPKSKAVDDHFAYTGETLGNLVIPIPKEYVTSIDAWVNEKLSRRPALTFNGTQIFLTRLWYAFAPLVIRIPLGLFVLMLLTLMWFFKNRRFLVKHEHSVSFLLLFPATLLLLLTLLTSMFNDLYSDSLICLPFLIIWVSAPWFDAGDYPMSRLPRWFGYLVIVGFVASSMHVFPYNQFFLNIAVGSSQNRHLFLQETEQDWGNDLLLLREWQAQNNDETKLTLVYAGVLDPGLLEMTNVRDQQNNDPNMLPPGWYAISKSLVADENSPWHAFQQLTPKVRIGRSMLLYEIEPPPLAPVKPELRD